MPKIIKARFNINYLLKTLNEKKKEKIFCLHFNFISLLSVLNLSICECLTFTGKSTLKEGLSKIMYTSI